VTARAKPSAFGGLVLILAIAGCPRAPGGPTSSSGDAVGGSTGASPGTSTGGAAGSSTGGAAGGSSGGTGCASSSHCANGYFWTVDCDGGVDGGACAASTSCNATGTACVHGRTTTCASDADCACGLACAPGGMCFPGDAGPASACASDADCGESCYGLTCVDGGCETLGCGPIACAPGCRCAGFDRCDCPLPDAGPACRGYEEGQCIWGAGCFDGGCGCPIVDPEGRCADCAKDSDCDGGLHCAVAGASYTAFETCVECTAIAQCGAGRVCDLSRNSCVPDCRVAGSACDAGCASSGVCGQCARDADCAAGFACALEPDGGIDFGTGDVLGVVPPTCRKQCQSGADCPTWHPVCNSSVGYCVDCLQDADCAACTGGGRCYAGSCLTTLACY